MISLAIATASRGMAVSTFTFAALACSCSALCAQAGVSPTVPTASQDPEVIDRIWQNASSRDYPERRQILGLVDQAIHSGPYRADWESLQSYEAPELVDIVSKNGNLLLNIGPRSDGTIPLEVQQVLREVGAWLKINGESIYGTRPWKTYGEGPTKVASGSFHDTDTAAYTAQDFRFTTRGSTLYAIELGKPSGNEAVIHSFASDVPGVPRVDCNSAWPRR